MYVPKKFPYRSSFPAPLSRMALGVSCDFKSTLLRAKRRDSRAKDNRNLCEGSISDQLEVYLTGRLSAFDRSVL